MNATAEQFSESETAFIREKGSLPAESVIKNMTPGTQIHQVLLHLMRKSTITQVEAHELYRVYRLASRINDLRNLGVGVIASRVVDLTGRNYTRYSLA